MKNIVDIQWLKENLSNPFVRIVDCRFQLGNPSEGFNSYMKEHIPGAFYFDLEKDLSSAVKEHGGRHPLPDLDRIVDKLGVAGVDSDTKVVAYDDQGGMMAARFWWLLKYLGHEDVSILDGGFSNWIANEYPVSDEIPAIDRKEFKPNIQSHLLSDSSEVKQMIGSKKGFILDSRAEDRYTGVEETIDRKAGHIPGALNYFWMDCLRDNNSWKSEDELKARFKQFVHDDQIIVYCGSGVTACPNIVALHTLGYKNVKLYVGSWSDWISYDDNPIAVGKEE